MYFVFFSDLDNLAWYQRLDLKQQAFRNFPILTENQQIDMFHSDQIDDFILEIRVSHVMRQQHIVFTGVVDQVLKAFVKPGGLPVFGFG